MDRVKCVRLCVLLALAFVFAAIFIAVLAFECEPLCSFLEMTHHVGEKPPKFGALHLSSLAICLMLSATAVAFHKRVSRERLDHIVFTAGAVLLLLECYKQLYYHAVIGNGHYNFAVLPFQLCSYALYLYLLLPLLPEGRIKDAFYTFTALYQTVGGGVVMAYPLLYRELALSVHTMLWHTVMVAVGVLILAVRGCGQRYLRETLPAGGIFLGVFAFGLFLNVALYPLTEKSLGTLNLFYLSPYGETNMFLIGDARDAFGLPIATVMYALLVSLAGANAMWLLGRLVRTVDRKKQRKGVENDGNEGAKK